MLKLTKICKVLLVSKCTVYPMLLPYDKRVNVEMWMKTNSRLRVESQVFHLFWVLLNKPSPFLTHATIFTLGRSMEFAIVTLGEFIAVTSYVTRPLDGKIGYINLWIVNSIAWHPTGATDTRLQTQPFSYSHSGDWSAELRFIYIQMYHCYRV